MTVHLDTTTKARSHPVDGHLGRPRDPGLLPGRHPAGRREQGEPVTVGHQCEPSVEAGQQPAILGGTAVASEGGTQGAAASWYDLAVFAPAER